MTHDEFIDAITKPLYVWRMARGVANPYVSNQEAPLARSGRTRMGNARQVIDALVLARAAAIEHESHGPWEPRLDGQIEDEFYCSVCGLTVPAPTQERS